MSNVGNALCLTVAMSLVVLGGWGCQSLTAPASESFASVKIGGHTRQEVTAATIKVFEKNGYETAGAGPDIVFEREGSKWDQIAFGDNVGGGTVINRVRAQVVDLGGGVCRVQCLAYVVRDPGSMVEDEVRLRARRSGPYREMLDEVVRGLTPLKVEGP